MGLFSIPVWLLIFLKNYLINEKELVNEDKLFCFKKIVIFSYLSLEALKWQIVK